MTEVAKTLSEVQILSSLSARQLQSVAKLTRVRKYRKDNILFFEGEEPENFFILLEGRLKLYKAGPKGAEVVLHNFNAPMMIAEMAVIENHNFPATAQFQTDGVIGILPKGEFMGLMQSDSELSFALIRSLTKKIKTLEGTINKNLVFDALTKTATLLYEDPLYFQNTKKVTIAQELNMAPETLSRVMKKLKQLHIIDEEHRLLDRQQLRALIDVGE